MEVLVLLYLKSGGAMPHLTQALNMQPRNDGHHATAGECAIALALSTN